MARTEIKQICQIQGEKIMEEKADDSEQFDTVQDHEENPLQRTVERPRPVNVWRKGRKKVRQVKTSEEKQVKAAKKACEKVIENIKRNAINRKHTHRLSQQSELVECRKDVETKQQEVETKQQEVDRIKEELAKAEIALIRSMDTLSEAQKSAKKSIKTFNQEVDSESKQKIQKARDKLDQEVDEEGKKVGEAASEFRRQFLNASTGRIKFDAMVVADTTTRTSIALCSGFAEVAKNTGRIYKEGFNKGMSRDLGIAPDSPKRLAKQARDPEPGQ